MQTTGKLSKYRYQGIHSDGVEAEGVVYAPNRWVALKQIGTNHVLPYQKWNEFQCWHCLDTKEELIAYTRQPGEKPTVKVDAPKLSLVTVATTTPTVKPAPDSGVDVIRQAYKVVR